MIRSDRIGVDVGGTFTDVVALLNGELVTCKVASTPVNPDASVLNAIRSLSPPPFVLLHGTTVATNAVLERKGARTAFVTTQGFRDLLTIGRQTRRSLYDLEPQPTPTVVPRDLCFELPERMTYDGKELARPTRSDLGRLSRRLRKHAVQAVAVCFLYSYIYPEHERFVGSALTRRFVSLSHRIAPEFREYERASTTAINAYVGPTMAAYLRRLESDAQGLGAQRVRIMHSSGGALSVSEAIERPVTTLLSGPAAGAVAAWEVARQAGISHAVSFDMGGTSTDVAMLAGGPVARPGGEIGGMPIRVPMMDIHTVGAGGGSLAWVDNAGALRVGPQSAGADPGPAAYGRGTDLTVTDANIVLGRLVPEAFAGGEMPLDPGRSLAAAECLGKQLGLSAEDTCHAVVDLANAHMARAIRTVSVARGYEPDSLSLVAFGGCGGLHACALADAIGIQRVLVPPQPGLLSAFGLLFAPVMREAVRSVMLRGEVQPAELSDLCEDLVEEASAPVLSERSGRAAPRVALSADLRYEGQSWELTLPLDPARPLSCIAAFHRLHRRRYGVSDPSAPVEWTALRARVELPSTAPPSFGTPRLSVSVPKRTSLGERLPVVRRDAMPATARGPVVIAQGDSTLYLPKGWRAGVHASGTLVVTRDLTNGPP
ncbi:MAG: hydantoinase/oxoprolinase family protein [Fimbriimonadia bacterium]